MRSSSDPLAYTVRRWPAAPPGIAAWPAVRFLTQTSERRGLTPFIVYCVIAGVAGLIWLTVGQSRGRRATVLVSRPVSTHPPM